MKIKNVILKRNLYLFLMTCFMFLLSNCGSSSKVKVYDTYKATPDIVNAFKSKNVLVIARTSDNNSRIAFEQAIAKELRAMGITCTESYKKVPTIHANTEMTEDRLNMIKKLMSSEGFNGVVLTSVKSSKTSLHTSDTGVSAGFYGNAYPGYYGSFYPYYSYPYAYGPYYSSFDGYTPVETTTTTTTTYVLETVAYNLDEPKEKQLVAAITTSIDNPKKASEIADDYVEKIMKELTKKED